MNDTQHYFFEVAYSLYVDNEEGKPELVEKTSGEHLYSFISGLGFSLEMFEKELLKLQQDSPFNFTIPIDEAYGEYLDEHVLELGKDIFSRNGKFDAENVFPGAILPMMNEDGNRLQGIVKEIRENVVVMDFNHPLAGKALTFKGKIVTKRPASDEEIQKLLNFTQNGCCSGKCSKDCENDGSCCGNSGNCDDNHKCKCEQDNK